MTTTTTTTDLAVQETALLQVGQLQEIVATAPEILESNITSKTKCIEAGQKLVELAKTGMNDVYDAQLATFIIKAKKTVDLMNERRKPFTQIVDAVKKQFTTLESELKPIMDEVKALRDDYATQKMKEKQEADRIAQLQLNKDKELIEIRQLCDIEMGNFFSNCIDKTKNDIISFFNALTLETIDNVDLDLFSMSTNFDTRYTLPTEIILETPCMKFTSLDDYDKIVKEVLAVNYSTKKYEYTREITSTLKEYKDKLPSKKAELIEISKAGEEEKKRLEEAAIKRQKEEKALQETQRLERERKAQEEAAISASAATAGAMIDASVASSEAPNVKEGYLITLKSTAGYLLLVQFWFEKEGKTMSADKFEKFTFDRVKRFCEAYAAKNEEFIQSPLIEYQPVYKAK